MSYWLQIILFGILISASTVFLLEPIIDNDFFWHLKTGEWIWQHGRLPDHDVFSYTTPTVTTASVRFTLTSYWLSQLLLYMIYLFNGMTGIVVLRFILMATLVFIMVRRRHGDGIIYMSLLALFSVAILKFYLFERPQVLSFLFFGMLLLLLEKVKTKASPGGGNDPVPVTYRYAVYIALLMLVWANFHGGHSIGQVTLLLFLIMEGVKFLHPSLRPMRKKGYGNLLIAGLSGLAFSLINPNLYGALELALSSSNASYAFPVSSIIEEFSSMPEFFRLHHAYVLFLYLLFMVLAVAAFVISPRETDITEAALLLGLGYYSFMHVRYAAFFPIAALPLLGRRLSRDSIIRWGRGLLVPLVLVAAVFFAQEEFSPNIATAKEGRWINNRLFPVKAADFIIANNIKGNMYNNYDWGGYLIWRLAPERKVFVDGRSLNAKVSLQAMLISMANVKMATGEQVWKSLLQRYGVTYILTDSHSPSGEMLPLVTALLRDKEWVPVFSDRASRSMIFVKDIPVNAAVIKMHSLSLLTRE